MEFQSVIEARQSVRSFNGQAVSNDTIKEIITACQQAPSWKNSQTSRYYVVSSAEMLEKFRASAGLPEFNLNSTAKASAYIISTFVKNRSGFQRDGQAENDLGNGWGAYDLGLHDMLLTAKATELGLATLIMGIRDEKAIAELLDIPAEEQVVSVIGIGYADAVTPKPARKAVEDITKFF